MLAITLSALLLLSAGASIRLGLRPPASLPPKERAKDVDIFPGYIVFFRWGAVLYQGIICFISLAEAAAYLAKAQADSPLLGHTISKKLLDVCSPNSTKNNTLYPHGQIPPMVLVSCLLIISGTLFRAWSQNSLGLLFTWEPAIRPGHQLYTSGPYSIVRHPSYTGADIFYAGHIIFGFARHTFLSECIAETFSIGHTLLSSFVVVFIILGAMNMVKRAGKEDEMLKREFGKEWEDWARKTRFRLIPGIW